MKNIRVMMAFSNMLFSEGLSRILAEDSSITVTEILKNGEICSAERLESSKNDIVLTDFTTLYNSMPCLDSAADMPAVILLDTNCGKENIISAVLKKKVSGVLLGDASVALLKKAIRAVASGEVWIDNKTTKNLIRGINAIGGEKSALLTEREKEIAALTGEGYRNKEIAHKLNIGEPTVKTHLHRIFQKLNIKTRGELITYAIKNAELNAFNRERSGTTGY